MVNVSLSRVEIRPSTMKSIASINASSLFIRVNPGVPSRHDSSGKHLNQHQLYIKLYWEDIAS
jgi:hypothetical protein